MLHIFVITSPTETDTYIDELVDIFLNLSMKTIQVHLTTRTTLVSISTIVTILIVTIVTIRILVAIFCDRDDRDDHMETGLKYYKIGMFAHGSLDDNILY